MSAGAVESIARVGAAVSYLRVVTDEAGGGPWLGCQDLLDDPDALLDVVPATKDGIGTDRDDVAMSLFVQGWVFRVASLSIGASAPGRRGARRGALPARGGDRQEPPERGAGPRPAVGRGWDARRAPRAARRRPPGSPRGGGPPGVPGRRADALVQRRLVVRGGVR